MVSLYSGGVSTIYYCKAPNTWASLTGGGTVAVAGQFSVSWTGSPAALSLGTVPLGTTSASTAVTLTNNGSVSVTSIVAAISGTNAADFTANVSCPGTLTASSTCSIGVTFRPTIQGAESATLTITDSDSSSPQTVSLTGTGFGNAVLTVNPLSLAFGSTIVGSPVTQTINLCDDTDTACHNLAPLPVTDITIFPTIDTVDASNPFSAQNTCTGTLNPGAACAVNVTFNPTAAGSFPSGSLKIAYNGSGSPVVIPLSGTATSTTAPTLSSVAISPTSATITNGSTQQFTMTETFSDSSTAQAHLGVSGVGWSVTAAGSGSVTFDAGAVCTTGFAASNPCTARTVTKGDLVGAIESSAFGNTLGVTDTLGDSFTCSAVYAASPSTSQICLGTAGSTGSNTVNLTQSGSSNVYGFDFQFSGTNGLQDSGLPNGVGLINPSSATTAVTTGNFTLAGTNDLVISWMRDGGSTAFTNGSGFTYLGGSSGAGCNTAVTLCVEYLTGASSGTNAATWTDSASTTTWKVGAVAVTAGASQVATVNANGVVIPTATGSTTVYGNSGYVLQTKSCTSSSTAITSLACALPFNNAKDTIVVGILGQDASATVGTPTDTAGNTYTLSSAHTQGNGLTDYIFYSQGVVASGVNTISETWTGGGATRPSLYLVEVNGAVGGVDTYGSANTSTALCQPGAITTTNTYDIGIGFAAVANGGQIVQLFPQQTTDLRQVPLGADSNGNQALALDAFATVSSAQPLYAAAAAGPCAMAEVWFKTKGASTTLTISGSASTAFTRDAPPPDTYEFYPSTLFTTPIPGVPTNHLAANSDTIVSNIFGGTISASSTYFTLWHYDATNYPYDASVIANYYAGSGDPLYYVKSVTRQTGVARYQVQGAFFHGPASATMTAGGAGVTGDQAMSIWDQSTNGTGTYNFPGGAIFEFYTSGSHLTLNPACNATTQTQAVTNTNCWVVADCASLGFPQNEPNPLQTDTQGCFSSMGTAPGYGTLKNSELIGGVIDHALIINVNCVGGPGVYPGIGGTNNLCGNVGLSNTNRPVNGNHFFIDSTYNCATLPVWQQAVCTALKTYGGFLSDTGGQSSSAMFIARTDAQTPWIITNFNVADPLMTWWLAQTTSCSSSPNCTGTNGLQTFGSSGNPTEVVAPFLNMPGLLGHLHILNPCVDEFVTGAPGACNPN